MGMIRYGIKRGPFPRKRIATADPLVPRRPSPARTGVNLLQTWSLHVQGSYFVSHGSPMIALSENPVRLAWKQLGESIARSGPGLLLIVSAHWDTPSVRISGAPMLETIHDFYGFPPALYELSHDRQGSPDAAGALADRLAGDGWQVSLDRSRGIDHGAWVPLRDMPALAGVPVVQVSVQSRAGADQALALGKALLKAAPADAVVLASGSAVHNLGRLQPQEEAPVQPWADAFMAKVHDYLAGANRQGLAGLAGTADFARAHPSLEHWLPLLVAAGAAPRLRGAEVLYRGWTHGSLPMDVYAF